MLTIGAVFINDRDIETDYLLYASALTGWPGNLSAAPRDAPLSEGPQLQGATLDPRLIRRKPTTATITAIMIQPTADAARIALDNLRALLWSAAEVKVRTFYAPDRFCVATCLALEGVAHIPEVLDGSVDVTMTFQVKNGCAFREDADGYALDANPTPCPIGSVESRPVITIHGNGAVIANPSAIVRNAAGDVVQRMDFTGTLSALQALRIDTARGSVSLLTNGVPSDALAAGWWPPNSGDFPLLRPYDGDVEAGQYPSVAVVASSAPIFFSQTIGDTPAWTNVGGATFTRAPAAFTCGDGTALDLIGDTVGAGGATVYSTRAITVTTTGPKRVRFRFARSTAPGASHAMQFYDLTLGGAGRLVVVINFTGATPILTIEQNAGRVESVIAQGDGSWVVTCITGTAIAGNANNIACIPSLHGGGPASFYMGALSIADAQTTAGSIAYTRRFS